MPQTPFSFGLPQWRGGGPRPAFLPAALAAAGIVSAVALYGAFLVTPPGEALSVVTAHGMRWTLWLVGTETRIQGNSIISDAITFNVVPACTIFLAFAVYAAATLAFPAPWRRKLAGLLLGLLVLHLVNSVRLLSLYFVAVHWRGWYDVAHLLVWQPIMILAALALWAFWAMRLARRAA